MSDTVAGAMIGASIALIGMIVAKEGKVSELRQQWIDGLRNDVAKIVSLALHISLSQAANTDDIREANERLALVQLRLNTKEHESSNLITALNVLRSNIETKNPLLQPFAEDAVQKAQIILKKEWRRVKRGEWRYVTILSVALVSLIVSASIVLVPILKKLLFHLHR
jgi:hypothetical protein